MKRFLLAFLIGTAALASTSSCTKEYYDVVPSITMVYERTADQWQGTDNQAYLTLSVPELTAYYVQQGVVNIAYSDNGESTYKSIGTQGGAAYSYEYSVGEIIIKAEDPILEGGIYVEVPQRIFIKVTLTDADFVE